MIKLKELTNKSNNKISIKEENNNKNLIFLPDLEVEETRLIKFLKETYGWDITTNTNNGK